MSEAAEMLRRKADEWRAIGEEHCAEDDVARLFYTAIEVALRETANALELVAREAA